MSKQQVRHTFETLKRRLARGGFKDDFFKSVILPDWLYESAAQDPSVLTDIEIRVARFLDRPLSEVRDPSAKLKAPAYAGAHLRRVRDVDRDRLVSAIHSAFKISAAVVRSLRDPVPDVSIPPSNGLEWRKQINGKSAVTLDDVVGDLWRRGIPIIPLDVLPSPSFQGMAGVVLDRPVILLAHRHDEPGRIAFIVAHETGHIAAGDCDATHPVVYEDTEIIDTNEMESKADQYATRLLIGADIADEVDGGDYKEIAHKAVEIERRTGADASATIYSWAAHSGDYATATMAVKALYRASGARRKLREYFDRYVDLDTASESDRALLRCVFADPERDEIAD